MIRLSRTHYPVTALGYGKRLGVWVQGCPLACPGCVARDTWDRDAGTDVEIAELAALCRECRADGASGLTVSGGEPLEQQEALAALLSAVRELPDFDLMVYTGYELSELTGPQRAAAGLADVLITGRYLVTKPTTLIWRGSANQQLHLQTPLGRERYESYVDYSPDHPPIQVAADEEGVLLVGVPRQGTLPAIERSLTAQGISIETASWRRVRAGIRGGATPQ